MASGQTHYSLIIVCINTNVLQKNYVKVSGFRQRGAAPLAACRLPLAAVASGVCAAPGELSVVLNVPRNALRRCPRYRFDA